MQEIFLFSKTFRQILGPNQPPVQWVPGFFSEDKASDTWPSPLPPSSA